MTRDQLNTAHASAIDTGEIPPLKAVTAPAPATHFDQQIKAETVVTSGAARQPSTTPATPEGDAISRVAEEAISRAIVRLQGLDDYAGRPAWDQIVAEEMRSAFASLPPQPADLRGEVERLTAVLDAMTNRAKVAEYKRMIAVEEVQPMIIDRAQKAEARVVELEAELPKQYEMGRLAGSMVSALTAQPVAQEPVAGAPERIWACIQIEHVGNRNTHHYIWDEEPERVALTHEEWGQAPTEYIRADLAHPATPALQSVNEAYNRGYEDCLYSAGHMPDATPAPVEAGTFEEAFQLVYDGYRRAATDFDSDESHARFMSLKLRQAFSVMQRIRAQSAPVGGEGGEG